MTTLGYEYPKEQARCRKLLALYQEIGPVGKLGSVMIEATLQRADKAAVDGDLVAMLIAFTDMQRCKF